MPLLTVRRPQGAGLENPSYGGVSADAAVPGGAAMRNPNYTAGGDYGFGGLASAAPRGDVGYAAPPPASSPDGYNAAFGAAELGRSRMGAGGYGAVGAGGPEEESGYITTSTERFGPGDGIVGVTFRPVSCSDWFFMGLSNITQNHHGGPDQHYDDIDYCIGIMGNGKASARENEDEVFKDFQPPKGPAFKDLPAFLEHVVRDMAAKAKPDESKAEDEGGAAPMAE